MVKKALARSIFAFVFVTVGVGFWLSGCGQNGQGQVQDAEGNGKAPVGGTLHFYTSQPDDDANKLVEAFRGRYPAVDVVVFRSGTEEIVAKLRSEKLAGRVKADVLLLADAVTFEALKAEGLLERYRSPNVEAIPQAFVDPDGTYTGTKVMASIIVVNTKEVKTLPDSWRVFTSPEARGKAMMPSPLYSGAAAYNLGVFVRQPEFGWKFYEDMKQNGVVVGKGNGGVLTAVAGGEKAYGMLVDFMAARAKREGSPVEFVYPKEGVPAITEPVAIVKGTKNIKAAQAFVDFILSEEGQKLEAELGYTPIRPGIAPPEGMRPAESLQVLGADPKEMARTREAEKEKFAALFR
ncbi:ABC transporter substrate-binding protein [Hydrogenibacillus schlegelii]|uniref:ABC transporter substrate-binding protein n=1 Tax=Hydrogenibacillus schlegelii TaxID=1484 RepID=A0A179IRS9_HYDSH|nr:ABC transporter substrate-binding protein [Hydrogenibacillus schlegelii]OAR04943.1 ABC transporter substrate-binding protein [Hydrogenibacillus schlegelii]